MSAQGRLMSARGRDGHVSARVGPKKHRDQRSILCCQDTSTHVMALRPPPESAKPITGVRGGDGSPCELSIVLIAPRYCCRCWRYDCSPLDNPYHQRQALDLKTLSASLCPASFNARWPAESR